MNLGEKQELTAVKKVEFAMYLAENPEDETRVLLPAKQVPEHLEFQSLEQTLQCRC